MEYKDEEEYIEYSALDHVIIDFSEEEFAIILKFHPEWTKRLRFLIGKNSWDEITSYMFGDLEDSSDLYERFLVCLDKEKEKIRERIKSGDLISFEEFKSMGSGFGNRQTLYLY